MSKKLKFKDEEIFDDVTETEIIDKIYEKLTINIKNIFISDEPPFDGETPNADPAAEPDGGGELTDVDVSDDNLVDIHIPESEPVETTSKLYERESSLNFDEENKTAKPLQYKADGKSKKHRKPFGITGDTTVEPYGGNKQIPTDVSVGVAEAYEKTQLLECLREALQALTDKERQLIEYIYYDVLTERETAVILKISQPAVTKRKHKILEKLRNSLNDWINS